MARPNVVKKCRKSQGPCRVCGKEIEVGSGYTYWEFMHRPPLKVHNDCRSGVRRSWLTGSEILSTIWDMVDDFAAEGESPEEIAQSLNDFIDNFRDEVVEGLFQEKLDNMEGAGTGLENTPVYEELTERKDELENYLSELESVAQDIDSQEELPTDLDDLIEMANSAVQECPE